MIDFNNTEVYWGSDGEIKDFNDTDFDGGDFKHDNSLKSAIEISFFTDARVTKENAVQEYRGGWCCDYITDACKGSKFWRHHKSKLTKETIILIVKDLEDSIQWLIDYNIASEIAVAAAKDKEIADRLNIVSAVRMTDGAVEKYFWRKPWGRGE